MPRASRDSMMMKSQREKSVVTKQQKLYADAILLGATHAQANAAAGYSPTDAKSGAGKGTLAHLRAAREELEDITTLKRLDVMEIFLEAINMARTLADPSQMINGADKLAKMMGYYAPESIKLDVKIEDKVLANKVRAMSDEELYRMAQAKVIDGEVEVLQND